MKILVIATALATLAGCGPTGARAPRAADVAITHVTVIDATGAPPRPDATVLVSGNRIRWVGPASDASIPPGARVIDGRGKYLIPGLWDMHTHVTQSPAALALNVANGVTSVRDMGAIRFATARAWRDSIAAGRLLGPRMRIASPLVEAHQWLARVREWRPDAPFLAERYGPTSPADAERWVDSVAALRPDHIKVRNWPLDTAVTRALIDRAAHHRLPVVGHAAQPYPRAGVASFEHGVFPPSRASDADRVRLWGEWARAGIAAVPTLVAWSERLTPIDSVLARLTPGRDPRYRYATPDQVAEWRRALDDRRKEPPMDFRVFYDMAVRDARGLRTAGVPLLVGTDAGLATVFPGFAVHDELHALVSVVGMTPIQAIQAATLAPARFVGDADRLGTVEAGKLADLVLLAADPLADIRNTRTIEAVMLDGRLLTRASLDALLADAEKVSRPQT